MIYKDQGVKRHFVNIIFINKFNNYINENNIDSLFKINQNDSLFSKELQSKICELTNCIIKSVKNYGVDYQSFIGITLK